MPLTWDPEVSRAHALLEPVGEEWTLVDDGLSRNGSFVNGGRVHGRQRLHHRDRMCFGNTHVVFHAPTGRPGSESTARAPGSPVAVPLTEMQRKVLIALCRPIVEQTSSTPATNPQIAGEVFLSVDAVKAHLRVLFDRFGVRRTTPEREAQPARVDGARARRPGAARFLIVMVVQTPSLIVSPSASRTAWSGAIGPGASLTVVPLVEPRSRTA